MQRLSLYLGIITAAVCTYSSEGDVGCTWSRDTTFSIDHCGVWNAFKGLPAIFSLSTVKCDFLQQRRARELLAGH